MGNFWIYTGVLVGLILIFVLAATSPHFEGADGYPTGW